MTKRTKILLSVLGLVTLLVGVAVYVPIFKHQRESKRLFEKAKAAHIKFDLVTATERFQELIQFDPKDEDAHIFLGIVFMDRQLNDEAEKEFRIVLEMNPNNPRANGFLGSVYFSRGENEKAIPYFKKALELNPKGDAGLLLGIIALSRKDYSTAEKELKEHLERLPKDADGYVHLAKLYTQQEKYDEAVASYETAVRLDRTLNRHILDAGKIYEDRGEYDKAVALYKRTLKHLRNTLIEDALKNAEAKLAK